MKGLLFLLGVLLTLCSDHRAHAEKTVRRSEGEEKHDQSLDDVLPPRQMAQGSTECSLYPYDPDLPKRLRTLAESGTLHLAKYELEFPEYDVVPLRFEGNATYKYKPSVWYRVFSAHGRRLLTMAFNYDALSTSLLRFGAKTFRVPVVDGPPRCFAALTEAGQMASVLRLLMWDLETDDARGKESALLPWDADKPSICHQIIKDDEGTARIVFRCCARGASNRAATPSGDRTRCSEVERDDVIDALYIILGVLKIAFVLFGPLVLQRVMFEGSTKKTSYLVPLVEETGLRKTILVKKVRAAVDDESSSSGFGRRKDMKQFTRFRKLVRTIPSEAIVPVRFTRLDILVDHKELMTEADVPVGLFRFVYETFIRCGITRVEPLRSCCDESIFGSWSPRFLWLKLRKRCDCNRGCRDSCSWSSIFNFLGVVVLILLIPLPYYVRLAVFYAFEEDEVKDRQEAVDRLDLDYSTVDHNVLQRLTPTNVGLVCVYITYVTSLLLLSALRICDASKIDGIARACVTDMRHIRQSECLRMLCAHVLLPFEKFGVFGVAVAVVYWPLVLPLCLVISVFYCVPLLYVTGRLLVNYRPGCCRRKPLPTPVGRSNKSLSTGVTSFDTCFFLDSISPDSRPYSTSSTSTSSVGTDPAPAGAQETGKRTRQKNVILYRQKLASAIGTFLVGLLMLLAVCSVLVMYAEAFGFIVEVCVLTTLGAVVNSDRSIQYIILAFWAVVYAVASCRHSYVGYARLSRQLFHFIKTRLNDVIQAASPLRYDKRRNTAFKLFTVAEAVRLRTQDQASVWQDENDTPVTAGTGNRHAPTVTSVKHDGSVDRDRAIAVPDESIEYRDNRLHWNINSLVLFVDKSDVSRIPLDLFWEVCQLDMPGSPGPVHKAAMRATGSILCSLVFLSLLSVVILSFGNMYEVASGNQMVLMLVSGAIPLIIFLAVYGFGRSNNNASCINEYSLNGKVLRVILGFCQSWPVYDLSFTRGNAAAAATGSSREDNQTLMIGRHRDQGLRASGGGYDDPDGKRCDCGHRLGCGQQQQQRMWPEDQMTELKSTVFNPHFRDASGPAATRSIDAMQVDLLITVKDEQEDDNLRSEPVSLGSGMSINSNGGRPGPERTSPDDNQTMTPVTGQFTQQPSTMCVTNQPTNATRSRMTESADGLQGETRGPFALRKQSSASTLPVPNHVTSTATQADVVVDMTDDVVFVKKIGFASPRNTVSMRSLPSYKHRSCEGTSESAL